LRQQFFFCLVLQIRFPFFERVQAEAKYGVSHFWLCVGQYGVCVLARV